MVDHDFASILKDPSFAPEEHSLSVTTQRDLSENNTLRFGTKLREQMNTRLILRAHQLPAMLEYLETLKQCVLS